MLATARTDRKILRVVDLGLSRTTTWPIREHHGLEITTTTNSSLTSRPPDRAPPHATRIPLIADRDFLRSLTCPHLLGQSP